MFNVLATPWHSMAGGGEEKAETSVQARGHAAPFTPRPSIHVIAEEIRQDNHERSNERRYTPVVHTV